jgi:Flp pilus assembly protein TadG
MKRSTAMIFRRVARGTGGAEIAETAMILPLLFMMIMAIFWFGQAFRIYTTITHAARQGARAGVAPVCATCGSPTTSYTQSAINAVNSALGAANLGTAQITAPSPVPTFLACAGTTTVLCDPSVTTSNVCVQRNVQLSTFTSSAPGTCGTSVSFGYKYPYSFKIPLTSLNLNNITFPAQAQMRLESQ